MELNTVNIYLEQFCGQLHFLQTTNLNENFSPRGSILMSIKTEISDNIDTAPSEVEVESTQSINEVIILIRSCHSIINHALYSQVSYNPREEFFLFTTLMEATMIDRRLVLSTNCFYIVVHLNICHFQLNCLKDSPRDQSNSKSLSAMREIPLTASLRSRLGPTSQPLTTLEAWTRVFRPRGGARVLLTRVRVGTRATTSSNSEMRSQLCMSGGKR